MQRGSKKITLTFVSDVARAEGCVFSSSYLKSKDHYVTDERIGLMPFSVLSPVQKQIIISRQVWDSTRVHQNYFIHLLVTER